jgi:pilus assembly protein CpaE
MTAPPSLQVFALARTAELRDQLAAAAGGFNGTRVEGRVGKIGSVLEAPDDARRADVLLVDLDADDPRELEALQRLRQEVGGLQRPIIVTARELTPAAMRRLLREGIDDFLPQPLQAGDVVEALRASALKRRGTSPGAVARGRVLTFAHASGGVGTTTLAVNAACSLAKPKRGKPAEVCLIDLDVQYGSAALHFDLPQGSGIAELVEDPERLDADMLDGLLASHASGVRVLTAPKFPMPLDLVTAELVQSLLTVARRRFDVVVVDLPLALTRWTEGVMAASDAIVFVTQLNVPAIRQMRRLLDTIQEVGLYAVPLRIVANRFEGGLFGRGEVGRRQAEKALGRSIDHVIDDDPKLIASSLNQGKPALTLKRRQRVCRQIEAMIAAVAAHATPQFPVAS